MLGGASIAEVDRPSISSWEPDVPVASINNRSRPTISFAFRSPARRSASHAQPYFCFLSRFSSSRISVNDELSSDVYFAWKASNDSDISTFGFELSPADEEDAPARGVRKGVSYGVRAYGVDWDQELRCCVCGVAARKSDSRRTDSSIFAGSCESIESRKVFVASKWANDGKKSRAMILESAVVYSSSYLSRQLSLSARGLKTTRLEYHLTIQRLLWLSCSGQCLRATFRVRHKSLLSVRSRFGPELEAPRQKGLQERLDVLQLSIFLKYLTMY